MPNQNNLLHPPQTFEALKLRDYCYVATTKKFVLISDPLQNPIEPNAFDEIFFDVPLPTIQRNRRTIRIQPSQYLREFNREDRVVARMDMCPETSDLIVHDKISHQKVLNLYKPPDRAAANVHTSPQFILDLMLEILNADTKALDWVLSWFAWYLFRPERKLNHGLLISGKGGNGKSILGQILAKLDGNKYKPVTPSELRSNYQDWAVNSRLVITDEINESGNETLYNNLKVYFTEELIRVNPKGLPAFTMQNHLAFIFFSNHRNPISIEKDRRLFYLHSQLPFGGGKEKDYYFDFWDKFDNQGGKQAFLKYLREEIVPNLDPNFDRAELYRTEDHKQLEISSKTRLSEIIQGELSKSARARHQLFKTNKFFRFETLKTYLEDNHPNPILRNNGRTNAILAEEGLVREWHELDGTRQEFAWWSDSHVHLKRHWNDTSKQGRAYLKTLQVFYVKT
tara:strand:- start:4081 stop:5442 length:1362 start_codon:yes stop_codon:yes gene_type:complete